jgi:signal transduction histidine kinase
MRKRPLARRLSSLGRIFVALVLLAGLLYVTVHEIHVAADQSDEPRITDRALLAGQLVKPLDGWLGGVATEASGLSAAVGPAVDFPAVQAPVVAYKGAHPRVVTAMVVNGADRVTTSWPDPRGIRNLNLPSCTVGGAPDTAVAQAVRQARQGGGVVVTGIVAVPGDCRLGVVAAAPAAKGAVAVVVVPPEDAVTGLVPAAELGEGYRVVVVDPQLAARRQVDGGAVALSQDQRALVARGSANAARRADRYGRGNGESVGAYAPATYGWGLLVEQDADRFDAGVTGDPAGPAVLAIVIVFVAVFLLVMWFDVRRRRAARRADEHRTAFLAIVGHELRTPLTVIKGYTDTLATRWDALDDASRHMLVSNMAPQAQRQARVIEHLLTAAALQAQSLPAPVVEATDVATVLHQVADEFRPLAPLHTFLVHVDRELPMVDADARLLSQAIGELVDNAVRYSPSGGRIDLSATHAGRSAVITVDDEGVGLPADRSRLFTAFVQGEDVDQRLRDEGGIGVGLYIAKELLARMRGTVAAEPRRPTGTRMTVTLPVSRTRRLTPA